MSSAVTWYGEKNRLHAQKALLTWLLDHPDERTAAHARAREEGR